MSAIDNIQFHFQTNAFDFPESHCKEWIADIIHYHNKQAGELSVIFCTDDYLLQLNRNYLGHDYLTDIITFPMDGRGISGELYISTERVLDNAMQFQLSFQNELLRVIIHGVLHLIGFGDKTPEEKEMMTHKEDEALQRFSNFLKPSNHYFDWVYDVVRCIPSGRVSTYGAIANYLTLGSARMVGWALNQLKGHVKDVPAHRVVNVKGELSGRIMFGDGGERMGQLLKDEGVPIENHRVLQFEKYFWNPDEMNLDKTTR